MIKKSELIEYLGGTSVRAAHSLGYTCYRAENNINRLPDVLTERQVNLVIMRMKAKRIKVPVHWLNKK